MEEKLLWFKHVLLTVFKSELLILNGKENGRRYLKTIHNHLLPFAEYLPLRWAFMQDSASCAIHWWLSDG